MYGLYDRAWHKASARWLLGSKCSLLPGSGFPFLSLRALCVARLCFRLLSVSLLQTKCSLRADAPSGSAHLPPVDLAPLLAG